MPSTYGFETARRLPCVWLSMRKTVKVGDIHMLKSQVPKLKCVCVNPPRVYPIRDKIRPGRPYTADGAGVSKKSLECKAAEGRKRSEQDRCRNGHQTGGSGVLEEHEADSCWSCCAGTLASTLFSHIWSMTSL
ncbi:hypothetical protein OJAV_G00138510 [Oryzias javanicus]|uniref:Uncharacterized protein n=1 Tax=Oryzias javanicus TaxID=123683 RepID=A0A437CML9_ORYJA|nr:hypothetical protein OJAV_G00138510 [Oryzias javanicus]